MKPITLALAIVVFLAVLGTSGVAADAITLAQTVQAGTTGQYQIELFNATSVGHDYRLTVNGLPDALQRSFVQGGPVLDSLTLAANGYSVVTLRVEVPAATAVGRYEGTVVTTRDDGDVMTTPIVLNVENTYAVGIVSQNLNVTTFRGQEFTFDVTAANTGAAALANITLVVGVPAKWGMQIDPATVAGLEPGAEVAYHVRISVPRSQIAIDQPVPLSIHSDQVTGAESALTVRVQNAPSYLWAAGAVMLVAAAAVIVYFRASGRR